jgi:hypothetical protein
MSHRPRMQKKRFDECSHMGFGKYCHRCKQEQELKNK